MGAMGADEVVLVPDQCLRSLKSKMTASSSVNQPKGIVMKQEQCVFTELYMESKCSKFVWGISPRLARCSPPPFIFLRPPLRYDEVGINVAYPSATAT